MPNHIAKLLFKVLREFGVSITYRTLEQDVNMHPDYPSMQCVSDVLDSWKVKHVVMKLTLEKLRLLNVPIIAFLKNEEYLWVTKVTDSKVYFRSASGREKNESNDFFKQRWSGVVLAIENIDGSGEEDYRGKRNEEIKEFFLKCIIILGFVVLLSILMCFSWTKDSYSIFLPKLLLLFVNAAGCYISYILIQQEKRQSDTLSDKFCKVGKYIDCKKVTSSSYSSLFGVISWAELGAAYFSSVLLWVVIAPLSNGWLPSLWWFSLITLPFTLWSLGIQAFILQKWCLFCCSIVFLLWMNAAVLLVFYSYPAMIFIPDAALMILLFIACLVVVFKTSKSIGSKDRLYEQQRETAKIKYNILTIKSQLYKPIQVFDNMGFVYGNADSLYDIGLYVSIACSHCRRTVKELKRLMEIYPDFKYRLIFAVSSGNHNDMSNTIIRHLICLYQTMAKNEFLDMLDSWYEMPDKNPKALQKAFPIPSGQDFKAEIDTLYQFYQQSKINYTPAILLNGRQLSRLYSYRDLYGIVRAINAEE